MAAEILASSGAAVIVYDRMPTLGRKFLLAGRGGLNLTHSEPSDRFIGRYAEAGPRLRAAIEAFPPDALRAWCEGLGQATFVGSSGRVFPAAMKASPLLRAWLRRLAGLGVTFRPRHRWRGWDADGALLFDTPEGQYPARADVTVLALGGASWPHLGADGSWTDALVANGIAVTPLAPSNCGFIAGWSEHFAGRFAGHPLKNVGLSLGGARLRGEALITRAGLEGTGVYALSTRLREAIAAEGEAVLLIDLRPDMTAEALAARFAKADGKQSLANLLRKAANLSPLAIGLLREAALAGWTRVDWKDRGGIAALVKAVPVRLTAPAPIERAISTAGGIAFSALDENFMLRARPGLFAAGEMLDWEAPTGGYLLQACFSAGAAAARGALAWMRAER
jgi:uncharacterized flavoprotein (TIGR03862 family)